MELLLLVHTDRLYAAGSVLLFIAIAFVAAVVYIKKYRNVSEMEQILLAEQ